VRDIIAEYNRSLPVQDGRAVTDSRTAAEMMRTILKGLDHEECWVLYLNRANRVIRRMQMTTGTLSSTLIDRRRTVRNALLLNASGIIIVHNHPSGIPKPGLSDIHETEAVRKMCDVFDISLVDHVIVCDDRYFSFADNGESEFARDGKEKEGMQ